MSDKTGWKSNPQSSVEERWCCLKAGSPPTESIHAETSNHSSALHSLFHAEISQTLFEPTQQRGTTGSTRLSVTQHWSPTSA